MNLASLLVLISTLGPKVTKVWPQILTILAAVKEIMKVLNDGKEISYSMSEQNSAVNDQLIARLELAGVDPSEAENTVSAFTEFDSATSSLSNLAGIAIRPSFNGGGAIQERMAKRREARNTQHAANAANVAASQEAAAKSAQQHT